MNEKHKIFVIFVGNANLADSKFRCQRQHHSEAFQTLESFNRFAPSKPCLSTFHLYIFISACDDDWQRFLDSNMDWLHTTET